MYEIDIMDVEEVASYLQLSRNTVYKMAANGILPSYRVGRKLRFSKRDIDTTMASKMVEKSTSRLASSEAVLGQESTSVADVAASISGASEHKLLLAGDDIITGLIAHNIAQQGVPTQVTPMTGYAGLVSIYAGTADMCLVNLYDFRGNTYNTPYVQRLCPGVPVVVIRIMRRAQGLHVRAGNPKRISTWGALAKESVRLASREQGNGSNILQNQKLLSLEANIDEILGNAAICKTGLEAAATVAQGAADVCVGFKEEAVAIKGLQFLPMQVECVDLVIRKSPANRKAIRQIKLMVANDAFKAELQRVMECDTTQTGAIVYQC